MKHIKEYKVYEGLNSLINFVNIYEIYAYIHKYGVDTDFNYKVVEDYFAGRGESSVGYRSGHQPEWQHIKVKKTIYTNYNVKIKDIDTGVPLFVEIGGFEYLSIQISLKHWISFIPLNDDYYCIYLSSSSVRSICLIVDGSENIVDGLEYIYEDWLMGKSYESMSYLKMFDSASNISYSNILQPEYSELLGSFMCNRIKFDSLDKDILDNYFNRSVHYTRYTYEPGFIGQKCIIGVRLNLIFRLGKVKHELEIDKIKDEWFLVRKFSFAGGVDLSFWKCDQIHGLVDFLRSIGVISEKMDLKLNELYRSDRSGTFKKDYVKILTPIEYSRMDKEVDDSFISLDFINNLFKELSPLLKERKFQIRDRTFYHPNRSIPTAYSNVSRAPEPVLLPKAYNVHEIVFETISEDLSWGGIYPPLLHFYWELDIVPFEDEYFLINCGFSKRHSEIEYIKYKTNINNRCSLMVDGRENLLPVIKDMIKNYDLLS